MTHNRLNVLMIVTDEQRIDELGAYGSTLCRTPNLDRLAGESILFRNAYTSCPLCSPARATLLTGQYPHAHGVTSNTEDLGCCVQELNDTPELLPRQLTQHGYNCGYNGKWHLGTSQGMMYGSSRKAAVPSDFGFEGLDFPGHGGIGRGYPQYKEFLARHGYNVHITEKHGTDLLAYGTWHGSGKEGVDHFITSETISLMENFHRREKPFYIQHNFWGPHQPYFVPDEYFHIYENMEIPPWENFICSPENAWSVHRLRKFPGKKKAVWKQTWEPRIRHKYAFMTYIDSQVGRLLDYLDETGLRENTLVLFTTDHGDNLGGHGGLLDKGFGHFENTHHIPMLMRHPDLPPSERNDLVSLVDIYPTILEACSINCPKGRHGRSLLDQKVPARESVVVEFHGLHSVTLSMRTIRCGMQKYGWTACGGDEFYDLSDDPYEIHNRINDPKALDQIRTLQNKLLACMKDTGDQAASLYSRWLEEGYT
ncbi:MAG: hypothetical protein A2096_17740 [Spirochaetes bacterium GWF1_41_5]|nr:MAG: hypothetical protein A2096_17740 [Spirochaetes bacterium GWF1_41_5]HBE04715.1 hypothetical protein [Spirochaetia bacterium]